MGRWNARLAELRGASYAGIDVVQKAQNVQNPSAHWTFEQFEQIEHPAEHAQTPVDTWGDTQDERAAIVEYDGGAPRAWAEALARLDPNGPPSDVQPQRWLRFIEDCGSFLDGGWADKAAAFGWGPLDLFGCDRERPFADDPKTIISATRSVARPLYESERRVRSPFRAVPRVARTCGSAVRCSSSGP